MLDQYIVTVVPTMHVYGIKLDFCRELNGIILITRLRLQINKLFLLFFTHRSFFLSIFFKIIPHASRAFSAASKNSSTDVPATDLFNATKADLYSAPKIDLFSRSVGK